MKKLFLAVFLVSCFAVVSCGSDSKDEPKPIVTQGSVTVTPESVNLTNEAQTSIITVTADVNWNIASDATWCTIFPSGGVKNTPTDVKITVTALNSIDPRVAHLKISSGSIEKMVTVTQNPAATVEISTSAMTLGGQAQTSEFTISANTAWTATSDASWLTLQPAQGAVGQTVVKASATENTLQTDRTATVTVAFAGGTKTLTVNQLSDAIVTPNGYQLVWNDEFNDPAYSMPNENNWKYEVWDPYTVNNELQRYVAGKLGSNVTAAVENGMLNIRAIKTANEVISARLNSRANWKYGYIEARLRLPKGRGTWPAFWMMPAAGGTWPDCGEIDIMEEVGADPNQTSSSIHCKSYNHVMGTQKTASRYTAGAEDEFHVYALEWTEDYLKTYVDGQLLFSFYNDKTGNTATWPFNKPFFVILNLAWGGDWGGYKGVDESALPCTYSIDYVRVFQKK